MSERPAAKVATPELVHQLVTEIRSSDAARGASPLVIGARARPQWTAGAVQVDGTSVQVAPCPTPLAARVALDELGDDATSTLVVLTDLSEEELGFDLLARFVKPRLFSLNTWKAVSGRFGARQLDPSFGDPEVAWMADALLSVPVELVPRALAVLTVDTALAAVTRHLLGATGVSLDRLLIATADADFTGRVERTDRRLLEGLLAVLADRLGPAGALVTGMIASGHGHEALPAGLAAATVIDVGPEHRAIARIEGLTGVTHPTNEAIAAWARAAGRAFAELDAHRDDEVARLLVTGSQLATDWLAPAPAASDVLTIGFEARLERLGELLLAGLHESTPLDGAELRLAVAQVRAHRDARQDHSRHRADRAELAARLVSWLRSPAAAGRGTGVPDDSGQPTLSAAAAGYLLDGAWVDAARRRVGEGDNTPPAFADALRRISEVAHRTRAEGNRRFADALAGWSKHGTARDLDGDDRLLAIEAVLDDVVAPLAKQAPVLLVVLDGCGLAQLFEMLPQFRSLGLDEIGPGGRRRAALAALPTVTSVSRTSLLCGELTVGTQADEKRGLPARPSIARLAGPSAVVLHRAELSSGAGTGLPAPVVQALGVDGPRVVAAVINTIDDELSRGTYTREYRIENLDQLQGLIHTATGAGRVIVVTADHGHVLGVGLDGAGAVAIGGEGGERWRVADREPTDDEVLLQGPRVLQGGGRGVLAPWHDDLRYAARHGGYHGGATPDEALVPLAVFSPIGTERPTGWDLVADAPPSWWDLAIAGEPEAAAEPAPAPKKRARKAPAEGQGELFGGGASELVADAVADATTSAASDAVPAGAQAPWMAALEGSEVYRIQLGAIPRGRPDDGRIRAALGALHARGGVASFAAVGAATGMPAARVPGFLATLARVLNVDGFGVLTVDPNAQEARLDEQLLIDQLLDGRWPR